MNIPEGWKLVPVEPTADMAGYIHSMSSEQARKNYRAMLAVAPTPPAQEDEPIYLVLNYNTCHDGSWEFANKDEFDKADEYDKCKFYTRPQSDKLRKAAEGLLREYDGKYGDYPETYAIRFENLRKALEETE